MLIFDRKNLDGVLNFDNVEYIFIQEVDGAEHTTWKVYAKANSGELYTLGRRLTEDQADFFVDEIIKRYRWGDRIINLDEVDNLARKAEVLQ